MSRKKSVTLSKTSAQAGVIIERAGDVLTFTLDNAVRGNEVTGAMFDAMLAELRAEARKPSARGVQCADSVYLSSLIVRTELTVGPPPSECRHPLYWRANGAWGASFQSRSFGMFRSRKSVCHPLPKWEIKKGQR